MNNKKKYYLVDNVIIGANHVIGNAGLLNLVGKISPGQSELHFFADPIHIENVRLKVQSEHNNTIVYHPIDVIHPEANGLNKILIWRKKLNTDYQIVKSILTQARKEKVEFVVFCTIVASNLYRFKPLFKHFSDLKIIISLHGEIEYLFKKQLTTLQKLNAYFYKKSFNSPSSNVKFLTISKLIKEKLIAAKVLQEEQLLHIEHPMLEYSRQVKALPIAPKIAQLGVASIRKGSEKIFQIAEAFQKEINEHKLSFQVIGKLYEDVMPYKNAFVQVLSSDNQHISQSRYEQSIEESGFALSLMTGDEYVFRISGSLIDSIQYQIPLIALRHEYLEFLFREGGDIGYLCNSVEEINAVLKDVANRSPHVIDRYAGQVDNLKKLAEQFYDDNMVDIFRENLNKVGWVC